MALNGGALNGGVLNGSAGFVAARGGGTVVTVEQIVNALGVSSSDIEQVVGKLSVSGSKASINQIVEFRKTGSTSISVEQVVASQGSKSLEVEQVVVLASEPTTFFGRNGYEPRIYIGGSPVTGLHGDITCTFTEEDAPQLKFTIIPATGSQDIRSYRGKSVVFKIRESSGTSKIYTGKINTPDVMIIDQKIKFNCSLDIEQVVNNTFTRNDLDKIGFYNNKVFSTPKTTMQELTDRVSTIPSSLIVDPSGVVSAYAIAPKTTQDYTLTDANIYRNSLTFKFSSGQRYINKVNINMSYNFQRLHHHERTFATTSPHSNVCQMLLGGYTPLSRQLVYSAIQGSDWKVKGSVTYGDIYSSGFYTCSGSTVGWATGSCSGTTSKVLDSAGNEVKNDGNTQYQLTDVSCIDLASTLCTTASWIATTRFSQNIEHQYTITVEALQSQSDFGIKEKDDNFSLSSDFNSQEWEDYQAYTSSIPSGLSTTGTQSANFWIDASTNIDVFNTSINILLNRAKSDILKSHRDDRVVFTRSLWTAVTLKDTVYVNTARVTAKGKVYSYTHNINVNTGEATTQIELALSRSTGSATDSTLSLPTAPTSTPVYPTANVTFPGHYGEDPALTSGSEDWVGHIANKLVTVYVNGTPDFRLTQYPVSFVLDTPDIEASLRDQSILTASASYDVEIPDDTLTINFTDTNYE